MHQIYVTSLITSIAAVLLIGGFIKWRSKKEDKNLLLFLFLIELPMAFIAFYLLRIPLVDGFFKMVLGSHENIYGFIKNFYAPLTEEPAKLFPLIFPFFRKRINKDNFVMAAMAIGLGFGIGEIWLVGNFIAASGKFADMPWYYFSGFLNERFMVCIIHGAMTSLALRKLGNKFIFGILTAMLMHFAGNFPIYLSVINFGNLGKEAWQIILQIWVLGFFFAAIFILVKGYLGTFKIAQFFYGKSTCPECGSVYPPRLLAMNWFNQRYERCPQCKKWHWIKVWKKE
ncbi:MAG: hypothetical protein ABI543_00180 [Ignavibacteria bacterium]